MAVVGVLTAGDKKQADRDKEATKDKRMSGEKQSLVDVWGDELVVHLKDGKERRYEKRVLVYMLVKIYSMEVQKARQMCFGFGLDPS